jgi:hypothetical protein
VDRGGGVDPFAELKEVGDEYKVYDSHYERVGKVDDLLVDNEDRVLYIGVQMGLFGTNSTLVPTEIIRVNDRRRLIEISEPAETIRHAPHFGRSEELTPELENHVRTYFGLESVQRSPEHESSDSYLPDDLISDTFGSDEQVDMVPGERVEREEDFLPAPENGELQEDASERVESEEPVEVEEPFEDQELASERTSEWTPGQASSDEPISERLSEEPRNPWSWLTGSGVTVHRLRR